MVDSVQHSADEAVHIAHRQTNRNVTDLCNGGISQHTAEVILCHRHNRADKDTGHTKNTQHVERTMHYRVVNLEDIINKTNQSVCRSLAHAACDKSRSTRMGEGVGIRLPAMQREQRHLNAEADDKAGHSNREQRRVQMRHNACSEVCHVQRTGHGIQIADAQQIERSANRADQQVTEGCQHGFSAAKGNQTIAGQRHNLQIYIEVENVARDNHA